MGARLNRKERRVVEQRLSAADPALEIVNRDAAGIDVGNESNYVAVPRGRDASSAPGPRRWWRWQSG
jgi:hypothetical protein